LCWTKCVKNWKIWGDTPSTASHHAPPVHAHVATMYPPHPPHTPPHSPHASDARFEYLI
jgi:hypothetical protein